MSLTSAIADYIARHGGPEGMTVDQILHAFPTYSRDQLKEGLRCGRQMRKLVLVRPPSMIGGSKGSTPGAYAALPMEKRKRATVAPDPTPPRGELGHMCRVSSVWQLGELCSATHL